MVLSRYHVCPVGRSVAWWCCGVCGVSQPPKVVASCRVVSVEVDPVYRGVLGRRRRNHRGVVVSVEGGGPGVPGLVGGVECRHLSVVMFRVGVLWGNPRCGDP